LQTFDFIQNRMVMSDVTSVPTNSPTFALPEFNNVATFSITNPGIEYVFMGEPVTLGWINEFVRRSPNTLALLALENHHGGERIAQASFFTSRWEVLQPDVVIAVDGRGGFHIGSVDGVITTSPGTVVVRDGTLVNGRNIRPGDYVRVTLYRENRAGVVEISPAPNFAGVQIARGRIQSVDQGNSFRVQSMSLFDGQQWHFTPIERLFTIDRSTRFIVDGFLMDLNDFVSFTPEAGLDGAENVFNRVFNVVIDGSRAAWVTDAPHATESIRGIIYHVEGDTIHLRDTHVRDQLSGAWRLTSNISATATVNIGPNSIIVDRDQVVDLFSLQAGHQVRIMTESLPATIAPGIEVNGRIVLVER